MDVIERIRHYMRLNHWTEYRLAKEAGLAQSTVANIFRRNTLPSIPTLELICKAFGITMSRFFDDSAANDPPSSEQLLLLWDRLTPPQKRLCISLMREIV